MSNTYNFYIYQTKFGYFKISYENKAITGVERMTEPSQNKGTRNYLSDETIKEINEYFEGKRKCFEVPLHFEGTEFQKKVWNQLLTIPYGQTRSYKQIAIEINKPKAYRAVGNASNKNPIGIIAPCHRVIGSNGNLVGYAGGLEMKKKLLQLEKKYS